MIECNGHDGASFSVSMIKMNRDVRYLERGRALIWRKLIILILYACHTVARVLNPTSCFKFKNALLIYCSFICMSLIVNNNKIVSNVDGIQKQLLGKCFYFPSFTAL